MLWEVERLLTETENLPQIMVMENVTAVHQQGNAQHFQEWLQFLDNLGYSTYCEDLNAKDFGVAQNRNRAFAVSLLGNYNFHFPRPIPLKKCMKDYLEEDVDEKYYIGGERAKNLIDKLIVDGKLEDSLDRQTDRQTDTP